MIIFWICAALLAAGAAAAVLYGAARASAQVAGDDPTLGVYRRALAEIDDLADRGLVATDESRAARAEAGRRLLAAADRHVLPITRSLRPSSLIACVAAAPILAVVVYLSLGSPGVPDQPFSRRLAAWRAHPEAASAPQLAAALRAMAAERPKDAEPQRRLALLEISLGDPNGAAHAFRSALAVAPGRADLLGPLGEIMVWKAGGKVDGDAQTVFRRLLAVDAKSPAARYYLNLANIEAGRRVEGLAGWRGVLADLPAGDPRAAMLTRDIRSVETTGAPSAAVDGGNAPPAAMSAAIRGMVDGLATRLQSHPDNPEGWVRLVRAYGVLALPERQTRALEAARKRYARDPAVLAQLDAAARPQ